MILKFRFRAPRCGVADNLKLFTLNDGWIGYEHLQVGGGNCNSQALCGQSKIIRYLILLP